MNEFEEAAFRLCYGFYAKWREEIIETDDQYKALAEDVGKLAAALGEHQTPIGQRLFEAVLDGLSDLYAGGMKPVPANYFGREDL